MREVLEPRVPFARPRCLPGLVGKEAGVGPSHSHQEVVPWQGLLGPFRERTGRPSGVALVQKFVTHQQVRGGGWDKPFGVTASFGSPSEDCSGQGQVEHVFPFAS